MGNNNWRRQTVRKEEVFCHRIDLLFSNTKSSDWIVLWLTALPLLWITSEIPYLPLKLPPHSSKARELQDVTNKTINNLYQKWWTINRHSSNNWRIKKFKWSKQLLTILLPLKRPSQRSLWLKSWVYKSNFVFWFSGNPWRSRTTPIFPPIEGATRHCVSRSCY